MTLIIAYQGRGITRNVVINDAAGDPITPGANDLVRVIIGREGTLDTAPLLRVVSGTATANGSSVTKGATNVVRLDASDLALIDPGEYTFVVDYYDHADAREWKNVEREVISIQRT